MSVSFEAIQEQYVTFEAAESAASGKPCKITANNTVGACAAGDKFFGVVSRVEGSVAGVIMGGYVELPYTGTTGADCGPLRPGSRRYRRRQDRRRRRTVFGMQGGRNQQNYRTVFIRNREERRNGI